MTIETKVRNFLQKDINKVITLNKYNSKEIIKDVELKKYTNKEKYFGFIVEQEYSIVGCILCTKIGNEIIINKIITEKIYKNGDIISILIEKIKKLSPLSISIVVRETDLDQQLSLKDNGFLAITPIWKKYFEDTDEDGYMMRYK